MKEKGHVQWISFNNIYFCLQVSGCNSFMNDLTLAKTSGVPRGGFRVFKTPEIPKISVESSIA